MQAQEGLDVADDFAAGGGGEHLPDEALEGQAQGEDAGAAGGAVVRGGEHVGGEEVPQVLLELGQGSLADGVGGAAAQGGQAGAEGGEEGRGHHVHRAVVIPPY